MSFYQVLWYFLIYSFIGWIVEVIFHEVTLGMIVNRGFLNGPVCPIYGFGVLSVFAMAFFAGYSEGALETVPIWLLLTGGTLLATAVELLGGLILDLCFHVRWWDYSDKPFNLHGYICLQFSLAWGLGIAFVLRVIHHYIHAAVTGLTPVQIGIPVLAAAYLVYLTDAVVTVLTVIRLNRYLRELDDMQKKLRLVSDTLRDAIGTSTYVTKNTLGRSGKRAIRASSALYRSAANAGAQIGTGVRYIRHGISSAIIGARERFYAKLSEVVGIVQKERHFGMGRLLRSNPGMKHREYPELVAKLQRELGIRTGKSGTDTDEPGNCRDKK